MASLVKEYLKKLFSDLHSAIIGMVIGAIAIMLGGIWTFSKTLWSRFKIIMLLPTPLWIAAGLLLFFLLSLIYLHRRTAVPLSKPDPEYREEFHVLWDTNSKMRCLNCGKPLKYSSSDTDPSVFFCCDPRCNSKHILKDTKGNKISEQEALDRMRSEMSIMTDGKAGKEQIESLKGQIQKTSAQLATPSLHETFNEGNSETFKNLDISTLKIHAKRWLTKFPEALIQNIVLYRSSHLKHQGYFGPISAKYFIAFAVPEGSDSARLTTATQYYQTTRRDYLDLMASDFNEVYKTPPASDEFKKEWEFYALKPQETLPLHVMKNEPSIELYP